MAAGCPYNARIQPPETPNPSINTAEGNNTELFALFTISS
jgi:hypothetical protein